MPDSATQGGCCGMREVQRGEQRISSHRLTSSGCLNLRTGSSHCSQVRERQALRPRLRSLLSLPAVRWPHAIHALPRHGVEAQHPPLLGPNVGPALMRCRGGLMRCHHDLQHGETHAMGMWAQSSCRTALAYTCSNMQEGGRMLAANLTLVDRDCMGMLCIENQLTSPLPC